MRWIDAAGLFDQTVDQLDDPAERFAANPQTTGRDGGRELGLHRLARDGVALLGRLVDCGGTATRFADDLHATLERSDAAVAQIESEIDRLIEARGVSAPAPPATPDPRDGYDADPPTELDLAEAEVDSVLWATGSTFDFGWIDGLDTDDFGYPVHERGATPVPGLYFVGLHWLHTRKSGLLYGVGDDARHVVEAIEGAPLAA